MTSIENRLLSKIIDNQATTELRKFNVDYEDFYTQKETLSFIDSYIGQYGEFPPYTVVVAECPNFEYEPEVPDSIAYLCKKLKSDNAKRKSFELLQKEATARFNQMNGADFIGWLHDETAKIKAVATVEVGTGTNFAVNGEERKQWYLENKENRTYQYIPTPYKTLNEWLGGGTELGDYVLIQAYTNRGKSWIASDFGINAWASGNGVLHYSPELSKKQQLQRLDTLHGHFRNSEMRVGELSREEEYFRYLDKFTEENAVPYIVKTMGDLPKGLSIDVIEADLQTNDNVKVVIIDGFNLMKHRGNDGNRNNMANTSRALRQLFGKYGVVGIVVHQVPTSAERENRQEDETGARIVEPPRIDQYSETVAVIQDSCTILNFDQCDGVGKLRLAKARTPHVDEILELQCDFDLGYIKEVSAIDYI